MQNGKAIPQFDPRTILDRPLKSIDEAVVHSEFSGKTVLVSGAGGSIGSEICRQLVRFGAKSVVMIEASEFNLYKIDLGIRESLTFRQRGIDVRSYLVSATDRAAMRRIFKEHRPDTVIHAAAYKHVPLVEANPVPGIKNNINSTLVLAEAAVDFGTSTFLLISSDKAVRPTNVMGMTKRCCELIVQAIDKIWPGRVRFMAVRFGNVLASSGSVIPRFLDQIQNGGPVTVTHKNVTRYFMLVEEAVGLVLQSSAMSSGGEIFVLNMGEPVRICELAERLICSTGLEPYKDIQIEFSGLRPGEKMYEELILDGDEVATAHGDIFIAIPEAINPGSTLSSIRRLLDLADLEDSTACVKAIREIAFGSRLQAVRQTAPNDAPPDLPQSPVHNVLPASKAS